MIRKHIDLIAIGLLLCGIALYSNARHWMILEVNSGKQLRFTRYHRPSVEIPEIPRIPFSRD
jgi:hypothetical protein